MSAECGTCGRDLEYPARSWPVGECSYCKLFARLVAAETALKEAEENAAWVIDAAGGGLDKSERITLIEQANRVQWFAVILPDLDYEIEGGTWDDPKWAWTEHPWFVRLGLTDEECSQALAAVSSGGAAVRGTEEDAKPPFEKCPACGGALYEDKIVIQCRSRRCLWAWDKLAVGGGDGDE